MNPLITARTAIHHWIGQPAFIGGQISIRHCILAATSLIGDDTTSDWKVSPRRGATSTPVFVKLIS